MSYPSFRFLIAAIVISSTSACVSVGNEQMKQPMAIVKTGTSHVSKSEIHESIGVPWDVLQGELGSTGWLYVYLEKYVSNPLTFIPYAGLLAGGGHVNVYSRFYCFDEHHNLVGRVMGREQMYKSIFSEYTAMLDTTDDDERHARIEIEMNEHDLKYDEDAVTSLEWHIWLRESQVAAFQARLFEECGKNGAAEVTEFSTFLDFFGEFTEPSEVNSSNLNNVNN